MLRQKTLQSQQGQELQVVSEPLSSQKSVSSFALVPKKQEITYLGCAPSPHVSLWLIASCRLSSYNPPQLKDKCRCQGTKKKRQPN